MLQSLSQHPHVVQLYGIVSESVLDGVFMTVMERAAHGSLKTYIQQTSDWSDSQSLAAARQVGCGYRSVLGAEMT